MKLGWADFKYLSTHPVVSLRARDQGKRINSTDALWHKLGYEVYQQRRVDPLDTDQHPNQKTDDSDASLIRPETALEHKLDYDVYRDDAAEATTHRHSAWVARGAKWRTAAPNGAANMPCVRAFYSQVIRRYSRCWRSRSR